MAMDNKKLWNNELMDALVDKLGYIDYRDMLALNRYILDAKREGDYRQQARAQTLALALDRMSALQREQIDKKVTEELSAESAKGGKGKASAGATQ